MKNEMIGGWTVDVFSLSFFFVRNIEMVGN